MEYIERWPDPWGMAPASRLGEKPTIHPTCFVEKSELGAWTELMANTVVIESTFGDYSYTAGDAHIMYADVGKFSNIASHVRINPSNHPMDRVTLHHCTYRRVKYGFGNQDDEEIFAWRKASRCRIGHDTWFGHGAVVMPGVSVGNGAVVGAGAVATKDVPPFHIAVGVPAKVVKRRFSASIAERLERIAWWNWTRAELEARFEDFMLPIEEFVEKYEC
jgi:hypothetical protein